MKVKSGQVYLRWILGGPETPFIVQEVGDTSFTLHQGGIENTQTMDLDALEAYLESGDCRLIHDPDAETVKAKSKWKTVPLAVSVFYEGENPIFDRSAYHVYVDDEAGGPYICIKGHDEAAEKGVIELDFEALEVVTREAKKLMEAHEGLDG